jgi:N-acetylglucosamine-6-sulfatase
MPRFPRTFVFLVSIALLMGWFRSTSGDVERAVAAQRAPVQPDIVFVLTDDQALGTLWAMPGVRALASHGLTIRNAIVPDPLCCPARASILTGRYPSGHGVWSNEDPYGWPAFHDAGDEDHTIATALDAAGYRTGLIGKYLNRYNLADGLVPPGWDRWFAFDEGNGRYYDYDVVDFDAGDGLTDRLHYGTHPRQYSTTILGRQAVRFIESTPAGQPLFLYAAVSAPHAPSTPSPRDIDSLRRHRWQHGPAFNEADVRDKPRYIRTTDRLTRREVRRLDRHVQRATESLIAVDRMLVDLLDALRRTHRLSSTMVIFTSDNGFVRGQHRWEFKVVPYEESIRVPMVVRYDPMLLGTRRQGTVSDALVANVDIAPTMASMGGAVLDGPVDGVSFASVLGGGPGLRREVLLESIRTRSTRRSTVPSYCGLRTATRKYVRYATGEQEFYRLDKDPHELVNLAPKHPRLLPTMRHKTRLLCSPTPPAFSWSA